MEKIVIKIARCPEFMGERDWAATINTQPEMVFTASTLPLLLQVVSKTVQEMEDTK